MRAFTAVLGSLVLLSCTTPSERSLDKAQAKERITQNCVDSVEDLQRRRLQLRNAPFEIEMNSTSECIGNEQRRATAVLFTIPRSRERTWQVDIKSWVQDNSVFAPKIQFLDSRLNMLKEVPFGRFARRGNSYTETIFIDDSDAVRFLLIRSDAEVVDELEQIYRMQSRFGMVPLRNGFFAYTYGADGRYALNYSPFGAFSVKVKAYSTGPLTSP